MTTLRVEVAYAEPGNGYIESLTLPSGACVKDALDAMVMLPKYYPNMVVAPAHIGIFGKHTTLDTPLKQGDRVEIYRPLQADPKTARRKRAARNT